VQHDTSGESPVTHEVGIDEGVSVDLCQRIEIDLAGRVARDVDHALVL
jgi:hypothetical protein